MIKLVVFVPVEAADRVRLALGEAGAGRLGKYDFCAFVSDGRGYYRPDTAARPYRGQTGKIESAQEIRLETICAEEVLEGVLAALRASHPYEEIAYDLLPLLNTAGKGNI